MVELILNQIRDKKIIILGFGREGVSSYRFLRKHFPDMDIVAADRSENLKIDEYKNDKHLKFVIGKDYDRNLNDYDLISTRLCHLSVSGPWLGNILNNG